MCDGVLSVRVGGLGLGLVGVKGLRAKMGRVDAVVVVVSRSQGFLIIGGKGLLGVDEV